MRDVEASWARRPQPQGALPRYAAAGVTPPLAQKPGSFGNVAAAQQPAIRAPRQRQPPTNENPYKVEYAHSGGSGRGQRGRSSVGSEAGGDLQRQAPPSAMHPVPAAAPAPSPPVPQPQPQPQPQSQSQPQPHPSQAQAPTSYGLQPSIAPEPYSTDNVYRAAPATTAQPVTTPQPLYPAPPPQATSPSLVGTSSAPQARSIQLGSGRSGAFGGSSGGGAAVGGAGVATPGPPASSPFSAAPSPADMQTPGAFVPGGLPALPPLPPQL